MNPSSPDPLTDKGRLLFGAGFVFGVMFTMLILAAVVATVGRTASGGLAATNVFLTIAAGVFFAGVVGVALYVLAFRENRVEIPVGGRAGDSDGDQQG